MEATITTKKSLAKHPIVKLFTPNARITSEWFYGMLAVQIVIFLWMWSAMKPDLLPGPLDVIKSLVKIITDGTLITEMWPSLTLTVVSMARAIFISLILCYLSVIPWFGPSAFVATKGRYAALAGLQFVFMLWTNDGHSLKVLMLEFGVSVFFITGMLSVIREKCVPGTDLGSLRYDHARSLGMNPWRVWFEITILGTIQDVLDLIRQNFAMCWTFLTMVEIIVMSEGGVGKMMFLENKYMRMNNVLAIQLAVITVGVTADTILATLRYVICPWLIKK